MKFFPCRLPLLAALVSLPAALFAADLKAPVPVDGPLLVYSGRRDDSKAEVVRLGYSGGRVRAAFEGDAIGLRMDASKANWVNVFIDGNRVQKLKIEGPDGTYELASGLGKGVHTVEIVKATEGAVGPIDFRGFLLPEGAKLVEWLKKESRKIEFVGDSITCGYGIEVNDPKTHFSADTENFCDTYAWLAARELGADYLVVARSGIGMLRNYNGPVDGSPDNMPAIYERTLFHNPQIVWDTKRFVPDVVCINLGTNDFSTSGPNEDKYAENYMQFVRRMNGQYPNARIVMLMGPMNNTDRLRSVLTRVNEALEKELPGKVTFFELSKAGANGFGADYHPSQAQAKLNGEELATYLSELMGWKIEG